MKLFKTTILLIASMLMCSCSLETTYFNNNDSILVAVEESSEYVVNSLNPCEVRRGSDVDFKINFNDGFAFKSATNGYYEDGYLKVKNVQYPQTIHIDTIQMCTVEILTQENCHYVVTSDNPLIVEKGQNAIFDIEFEDGYVFESSSVGNYEDGKLIIEDVNENIDITLLAKPVGNLHVQFKYDSSNSFIKINGVVTDDYYAYSGEMLTIEAVPLNDRYFTCWSKGNYISKNMPFSFERIIQLEIREDTILRANFWNNDANTIIYSANGGSTKCGDENIYYPHTKANHIRINTIQGSNAFYKEGYLLDSWNTKPDGSGERVGLGSRVKITNPDEPLILYAIWVKETDVDLFDFELIDDSSYAITDCSSFEVDIVIPSLYNGLPITHIRSGAFDSLNFEKFFLSPNVTHVESNSIINCINFNEIHYYDSLVSIPNDFSTIMPSKLYINANTDPCYVGSYQSVFVKKVDLLLECDGEKIVFIGDSNTMYSIDGSIISNNLSKDVLCFGVQSNIGVGWELACLKYFCKNDKNTIVFCCEFGATSIGSFGVQKYYAAESNYDLLLAIDFGELKYADVFGSYTKYKEMKKLAKATSYSQNDFGCDDYGCLKINIEPYRSDDWCVGTMNINLNYYKNGGFNWVENYCSSFTNSNILISCCSFNKNSIKPEVRDAFYNEYQQSIIDYINYPVISRLEDYAFTGSAFTDDNYHLIYSYAVQRTNKLLIDLIN